MKSIIVGSLVALAILASAVQPAEAGKKKKVACTVPTLEAIVREVGGDKVEAFSLAAGDQDPHFVSPTPSLMKKVRDADLLFVIGMQLELWADEVADGSGNSRIFKGGAGRIVVSEGIPKLEVPSTITRSEGDVHPEGNPHLWLDPVRAKMIADNVAKALAAVDPDNATFYQAQVASFRKRVDKALFGQELLDVVGSKKLSRLALDGKLTAYLESNDYKGKKLSELAGGWLAKARPLRGQKVVEFHKVWAYVASTFGFQLVGTIEEKPGIAPGPRHIKDTIARVKSDGVKLILVDNFYDASLPKRVAKEGGATVVILPNQVRGDKKATDYFKLIDRVLDLSVAPLAGAK